MCPSLLRLQLWTTSSKNFNQIQDFVKHDFMEADNEIQDIILREEKAQADQSAAEARDARRAARGH